MLRVIGGETHKCMSYYFLFFHFLLNLPSGHTLSQGFSPARWEGSSLTAQKKWVQRYLWWTHSEEPSHCSVNSLALVLSEDRAAEGFLYVFSKARALWISPSSGSMCWRHPQGRSTLGLRMASAHRWLLWAPLGLEVLPVVRTNCPGLFRTVLLLALRLQANWDSRVPCSQINGPLWDTTELDNWKVEIVTLGGVSV